LEVGYCIPIVSDSLFADIDVKLGAITDRTDAIRSVLSDALTPDKAKDPCLKDPGLRVTLF
tara:strand:+ start:449 stop:631 length:183 start_codon:yes stop_codon:yes gene_type:complete